MKKILAISIIVILFSCKEKVSKIDDLNIKTDSLTNIKVDNVEVVKFENYQKDGILLKGNFKIYDENLNEIEELKISEIKKVLILGKTKNRYNLKNSKDYCEKACFLKVNYKNEEIILFGQTVYEINKEKIFPFTNPNGEKCSIFPITNFEMGASDEDGLTDCDDYSVIIIENERNKSYSIISYPQNENIHNNPELKKGVLFHDDGSEEKIYKVSIKNDTLVIGIKAEYQEGGAIFNLKTTFKNKFSNTIISDKENIEPGN
jgi:hypothetical protein